MRMAVLERLVGDLMPLVGRQIDDRGFMPAAPAPPRLECPPDGGAGPPPDRWNEQQGTHQICYKAWKNKKNSSDNASEAGGFEVDRAGPVLGDGGTE
ncbi:MAG: hypothetical protein QOC56_2975, partial [Alphaproteobacteria bacterium]|nr:hypothetical protein [Alphaproteobacteria bacterium]